MSQFTRVVLMFISSAALSAMAATPEFPPWGVTLSYMDSSVSPGADFFRYTNGTWLKTATIPPDRRFAGVNLEMERRNEARLKTIVTSLSTRKDAELSAEERKLRDLYDAFEDTRHIEAAGLQPVRADLARIAALKTARDLAVFMGTPATQVGGPFDVGIDVDDKNPDAYAVQLAQSGLGMPDRDYYLLQDKDSEAARKAYQRYISDMLGFAGVHDPARATAVYALEEQIAHVHWPAAERREADKTYNPMSISELERFAPQFPWSAYLTAAGITARSARGERVVIVREKSAFPGLATLFAATPVPVWRDYLTVRYLHARANYLPRRVDERDFAFYGVVLGGQKQQLPRDLRGISLVDGLMGEALGKLYVAQYFPPEAKAKIRQLVDNLLKAYAADISTLSWMSPATRDKALDKIRHFTVKVGYPDKW